MALVVIGLLAVAAYLLVPGMLQGQTSFNFGGLSLGGIGGGSITSDDSTWPSGDRIWNICRAIAYAEGANIAGSVPDRLNNPGDLSDGASQFGYEQHSGSNVTIFPDKETGWEWLRNKVSNAASGASSVYRPEMTWVQIGKLWAGDWQNWVANVTGRLGVDQDSTLQEYMS